MVITRSEVAVQPGNPALRVNSRRVRIAGDGEEGEGRRARRREREGVREEGRKEQNLEPFFPCMLTKPRSHFQSSWGS